MEDVQSLVFDYICLIIIDTRGSMLVMFDGYHERLL